jgi:acyl carrier protein
MDLVKRTLFTVAPDLEGETIDPEQSFRKQFEIDSMDFLNFIIGLSKLTGLEIPETDYPQLQTPNDVVQYLRSHWPRAFG